MRRQLKQRTPNPPSARDYDDQERRLAERGDVRTLQPSTERLLADEWVKWEQYCLYRGYEDSLQALREISDPGWPIYLDWRCANSPFEGHCVSTVYGWFKRLCGNYLAQVSREGASRQARAQVRDALKEGGWLVRKYSLNTEGMDKEVVNFDDFFESISVLFRASATTLFFRSEQRRAQTWMFELFLSCTGMRPGSFLDNSRRGQDEAKSAEEVGEFDAMACLAHLPRYRDCRLTLFPAENGGPHGDWVLEVEIRHVKGGIKSGQKPVTFLFHQNPCLALCPIMAFLQRTFAIGAFAVQDLTPASFFGLRVPPGAPCLPVTFKPSMLETPLFQNDDGGVLSYETMRVHLVRLGEATGFPHGLKPYNFRRGVANAIHGKTTTAVQNKALHHSSIAIYERHYQNRRLQLDVQNTFLGIPGNDRLLKLASAMGRTRDLRRPRIVDEEDLRCANESEELLSLVQTRTEALEECREKFGSITGAKGSVEYAKYTAAAGRVGSTRRRLAREALRDRQTRHDQRVAVEDVEQQLRGSMPAVHPPVSDEHMSPNSLRSRVVAQLFTAEMPMPNTAEDATRRASALANLIELYTIELPHHKRRTVTSVCTNCGTGTSAAWRRADTALLCSACSSYRQKYGRSRPHEVIAKSQIKASTQRCGNTACATDTSAQWYYTIEGSLCASKRTTDANSLWAADADRLCSACYQYYQRHKCLRSREQVLQFRCIVQFRKQPRRCANAACKSTASKRWHRTLTEHGALLLCQGCHGYHRRHERLRPRQQVLQSLFVAQRKGQPRQCSNEACATKTAWHWYRTNNGHLCGPCHRDRQRNNRHRPQDVGDVAIESSNRERPCRPEQSQPTMGGIAESMQSDDSQRHLQLTGATSDLQLEFSSFGGSPATITSPAVSPWSDDLGSSDMPLAVQEPSSAGSSGIYFTDLLYPGVVADLRLDDLDLTRETSQNTFSAFGPVEMAAETDCHPDDVEMAGDAGWRLNDDETDSDTDWRLDDDEMASDANRRLDDDTVETVGDTAAVRRKSQCDDPCDDGVEAWPTPTRLPGSTCLFCYFNPRLGEDRQTISVFTARCSMQRHAENTHFREMRVKQSWVCPDDACSGRKFETEDHLKNHAATEHLVLFAVTAQDRTGA